MPSDLYQLPSSGAEPTRFCGGNLLSDQESCVEIAAIPGASAFIVRDTKAGGSGRELRFTTQELDNFALGYVAQRGLTDLPAAPWLAD
jgi:hypothetical protein